MKANLIQTCLLAAALLALPAISQGQFNYITNNGTITITGYTGTNGVVNIPAQINGLDVTSIRGGAFNSGSLTNVAIPNSVTNIGVGAFEFCGRLTAITVAAQNSVYSSTNGVLFDKSQTTLLEFPLGAGGDYTISQTVTNIGDYAFYSCRLTSAVIPNSVTDIGSWAFAESSLTNVTIPDSVTGIGDKAFAGCRNLTSATIANGVVRIGNGAFSDTGLTSVTIPNSIVSIPDSAFEVCYDLTNVTIGNRVGSIGNYAFYQCGMAHVTIPDNVTNIGDSAFYNCYQLTSIAIPNNVTRIGDSEFYACGILTNVTMGDNIAQIGDYAFYSCGLTSVTIGGSVTNIGFGAFADCSQLIAITVAAQNQVYSSLNGVLFDKSQTELLQFPCGLGGSYTIPNGVIFIGTNAFAHCANLTIVVIPNSVTSIADYAFMSSRLSSVIIGNSVTNIGVDAFAYIGDYGYYYYPTLTNVFFMGNAPAVDPGAFIEFTPDPWAVYFEPATVYYLPYTTGWSTNFAGLPTALWLPQVPTADGSFGVQSNQFGFDISWASGQTVVVEAATNLFNPVWLPVSTNTLVTGASHFSDPQPANLPSRFYRLRSP